MKSTKKSRTKKGSRGKKQLSQRIENPDKQRRLGMLTFRVRRVGDEVAKREGVEEISFVPKARGSKGELASGNVARGGQQERND
jgi:hypothetical protein